MFNDTIYINPFGGLIDGNWVEGDIAGQWLREHFGHCKTLEECIATTTDEGLKLFFEHLLKDYLR